MTKKTQTDKKQIEANAQDKRNPYTPATPRKVECILIRDCLVYGVPMKKGTPISLIWAEYCKMKEAGAIEIKKDLLTSIKDKIGGTNAK